MMLPRALRVLPRAKPAALKKADELPVKWIRFFDINLCQQLLILRRDIKASKKVLLLYPSPCRAYLLITNVNVAI